MTDKIDEKLNNQGEISDKELEAEEIEVLSDADVEVIAPDDPGESVKFSDEFGDASGAGSNTSDTSPGTSSAQNQGRTIHININGGPQDQEFAEGMPGFSRINKHLFVWVFTFFLGTFGIDRFARGQIFFGLLKLLTAGFSGIWTVLDFLIAFFKAYIGPFVGERYFTFFFGHWTK